MPVKNNYYSLAILLLWLVMAPYAVMAQKSGQARIDSLLNELKTAREDTAKVVLLVRIGNNYKSVRSPQAANYYQQSIALAEKLRIPEYIFIANETMRSLSFSQKDNVAADRYLARMQALPDPDLRCKSLIFAGYDHYLSGDHARAKEFYFKALKVPGISLKSISTANFYIGSAYYIQRDTTAIHYYRTALAGFTKINDRSFMRRIDQNLGGLYLGLLRDLKTAMRYYQQAVDLGRNLPEDNSSAGLTESLATVYQATGDTVRALTYYAEALRMVKNLKDTTSMIALMDRLSSLHFQKKIMTWL